MLNQALGGPAIGDAFFDRDHETTAYWRGLATDNLLLLAPRRVGKTSVMKRMEQQSRELGDMGLIPVFLDVSACGSEMSFVEELYRAVLAGSPDSLVWNRIQESGLGKFVRRVSKLGVTGLTLELVPGDTHWERLGEELAQVLSTMERRWLILIDELPVFLLRRLGQDETENRQRIKNFLYWLRRLRQEYRSVRWLLAGSVGLDTVARRLRISDSINDLLVVTLDAFDARTADAFLEELAKSYNVNLTPEVRRYIVQRSGWPLPYFLQLVFGELRNVQKPVAVSDVDAAVAVLLDVAHRNYFAHWDERLDDELGRPDAGYAKAILNTCCRAPEGASHSVIDAALSASMLEPGAREERLRALLDVLERDGYLIERDFRWLFRFPLLREYWVRRVAPPLESRT